MKLLDFMNNYSRYGKVDIPNICEQCVNLNREYISNERKEENKMERHIKIIIRKDFERSSNIYSKYRLEALNQQDKVIFTDYFTLGEDSVLVYLSDTIATILDVYSFEEYVDLLKSCGITHKIEKITLEEDIRRTYNTLKSSDVGHGSFFMGYRKALEYVLGIDNE